MSKKTWSYVIVSVALAVTLQACGGGGGGGNGTVDGGTGGATDTTAPVVSFSLPATAASLTVSVDSFTATDDKGVTGFMVTQSSTQPAAGDAGWTAIAPTTVTAAAAGSQAFFPWAKDAAGNVSAAVGTPETVTITLPILPVSVAVSASGTDTTSAVGADATFTFAAGAYQYNISGFGAGDKLVFPVFGGAPNALSIVNPNPADGIVTVEVRRNVGGQQFLITVVLDGLSAAQDQQIVDGESAPFASFNALFGANSIQEL